MRPLMDSLDQGFLAGALGLIGGQGTVFWGPRAEVLSK